MADSLAARQQQYEEVSNIELTRRLPVIIRCDGRGFHKFTSKLSRPFSPLLLDVMVQAMTYAVQEMPGAIFAYQQSDEITFVLRNDQTFDTEPWHQNKVQKLASASAALVTFGFNKALMQCDPKLSTVGDALFDAKVFTLPYYNEVLNHLIWRQQDCIHNAVSAAASTELTKKIGKKTARKLVHNKSISEKVDLLRTNCKIEYNKHYPSPFRRGVLACKVPIAYPTKEGEVTRNKWIINSEIPIFSEDRDYIYNILINGRDVFRTGITNAEKANISSVDRSSS